MPTYAYACKQCAHRFETVQSFADQALTVCPECGGVLRKEYGSIGVTFNGSGFYRTDSRPAQKSEGSGSEKSSSSEKGSSEKGSSEKKTSKESKKPSSGSSSNSSTLSKAAAGTS